LTQIIHSNISGKIVKKFIKFPNFVHYSFKYVVFQIIDIWI